MKLLELFSGRSSSPTGGFGPGGGREIGPGVGVDVDGGMFEGSLARFGRGGGSSFSRDMRLEVFRSCAGRDAGAAVADAGGLCCLGGYGSPRWLDICLWAALIGRWPGGVVVCVCGGSLSRPLTPCCDTGWLKGGGAERGPRGGSCRGRPCGGRGSPRGGPPWTGRWCNENGSYGC